MVTTIAGMLIGLPTLRLRGDYIAIVTLAFGEIVGRLVINGDQIVIAGQKITNGRQGITPVDKIDLPFLEPFTGLELRPWYWVALALVVVVLFVNYRLRDSRLGRAWIALREDEVAAASMGVPLVKTKLLAYGTGAAFGGIAGVFLGSYLNTVNADQFQFSFSIFILAMVILGGLGSIEGVVLGAVVLSFINFNLIPDVFNDYPSKVGLDFDLTELSFGIFGFLLVIMMVLRPEGLIPERRRKLELTEGIGAGDTALGGGETIEEVRALIGATTASLLTATNVTKVFGGLVAVEDVTFEVPERVDRLDHRPERRGQDDLLQHAHRAVPADLRPGQLRRQERDRAPARPDHEGRDGPHVPEHPPVRHDDGARERDGRPERAHARGAVRLDLPRAARDAARSATSRRRRARRSPTSASPRASSSRCR